MRTARRGRWWIGRGRNAAIRRLIPARAPTPLLTGGPGAAPRTTAGLPGPGGTAPLPRDPGSWYPAEAMACETLSGELTSRISSHTGPGQ